MRSLYPIAALIVGIIFLATVPPVGVILILVAALGQGGGMSLAARRRREAQRAAYARAYQQAERESFLAALALANS